MSTYCSDDLPELPHPNVFAVVGGVYEVDVASCCVGSDVRLILDRKCARMEPHEARALAAALVRCADQTERAR